jgi:hypothetical protein
MIRGRYVRKQLPHTEVTVIKRKRGFVTYLMHLKTPVVTTISEQSFKDIYRKVRKWQS